MELSELREILESTGLPVAYYAFLANETPEMPFLTYRENGSNNFAADGVVFFSVKRIQVDLFTKTKNIETERKLEAALTAAGVYWEKDDDHDDDERCHIITYEMEI